MSKQQLPPFETLPADEQKRFEDRATYLIEHGWIQTNDSIAQLARNIYAKVGKLEPYESPFKDHKGDGLGE